MKMAGEPTWFGQPRGLTILFLTNMWETFSYYGMRALLVYYMTKQLGLGQGKASLVYGTYIACAYLTPIAGGVIADRLLGKRRAIVIGATVMAVGHFLMTWEALLYVALATIALGNGLFLPTLPSQIDDLYAPGDPRVGWAYNVYYVGVNIGGFLAPLVCGTLGEVYGWHCGFAAAGIGMCLGLAIYLYGQRYLPPAARHPRVERGGAPPAHFPRATLLVLVAVALAVAVFRGAYEQVGNTVAVWADASVDRAAFGGTIPITWFFSLNPLLVMLMTPLLLALWRRRVAGGGVERPARRMALGALVVAGSYLMLAALAAGGSGSGGTAWPWFAAFFLVYTLGEILILPTGLGLFARLAPAGLGATTVAAWYLTIFAGSFAAGLVGTLFSTMTPATFFALLAGLAGLAAVLLWLTDPLEQRVQRVAEPDRDIG